MSFVKDRTVLITGANTGIGRATAIQLAKKGARMFLAGRSEERYQAVLEEIGMSGGTARFLPLDLSSLVSVRACAEQFLSLNEPLHVLINNAGLAGLPGRTTDGFERTFGVNHLGHFLLTELLIDVMKKSAPARIINVASSAHYQARGIDWSALTEPTASFGGVREYQVSKLCNVLYTKELADRLKPAGITTYSLHPGVIASEIWRNIPWGLRHLLTMAMTSTADGASTSVYCADSDQAGSDTGLYYEKSKPKRPSSVAEDRSLAQELFIHSQQWAEL